MNYLREAWKLLELEFPEFYLTKEYSADFSLCWRSTREQVLWEPTLKEVRSLPDGGVTVDLIYPRYEQDLASPTSVDEAAELLMRELNVLRDLLLDPLEQLAALEKGEPTIPPR